MEGDGAEGESMGREGWNCGEGSGEQGGHLVQRKLLSVFESDPNEDS